uniref:Uncharacterized protein n=1 Tax=Rhizophora mucronata TaxID=61149 RepID=A0A2P2QB27_RHIMU
MQVNQRLLYRQQAIGPRSLHLADGPSTQILSHPCTRTNKLNDNVSLSDVRAFQTLSSVFGVT